MRVMRVCLIAREKSVTYLIKIETACVGETKIYFWSESFFVRLFQCFHYKICLAVLYVTYTTYAMNCKMYFGGMGFE